MHCTVPHCSEGLPLAHVVDTVSAERERKRERERERNRQESKQTKQVEWESNIQDRPHMGSTLMFPKWSNLYVEEDAIKDMTSTC